MLTCPIYHASSIVADSQGIEFKAATVSDYNSPYHGPAGYVVAVDTAASRTIRQSIGRARTGG